MKSMRKILSAFTVFVAGLSMTVQAADTGTANLTAQERMEKQDQKEERKRKRQQRMDEWKRDMEAFRSQSAKTDELSSFVDSIAALQAGHALNNMSFVLEADYVTFKRGTRVMVHNGTTFISLDGDRAVVQISPSTFYPGPNGVGGVTVVGTASNIRVATSKNGETVFSMSVAGLGINAQVDIRMPEGSNRAFATVIPNFSSNTIRLEGWMKPASMSGAVEGMSL